MAIIAPVLLAVHFSQAVLPASSVLTTLVASTVRDFFTNIFMNPGANFYAVIVFAVVPIGIAVGLAFLIKKIYEKCFPPKEPPKP
jgi:hypothetical protein